MFRILVVEDAIEVLMTMRRRISEEVIGSIVDTAETVLEARALIDRMDILQDRYDCAVLDFNLPFGDGSQSVDSSLCLRLGQGMKNIGVIHITSQAQASRSILDHIRDYHLDPSVRACGLVDKADVNFYRRTCEEVRRFLYSRHLEDELDRLFSTSPFPIEIAQSATTDLQRFQRDAVQMWPDLPEITRERINGRFEVDPKSTPVTIRLR